ncbi:hypothetical protein FPOAC1_011328 [Fusarium poae]|uniref:hypothetical protein n=1 Tax=Fusarium poae TaxID=36050 RepID=UPI001CE92F1D|nr:hypothetical protein FPOAC1_011328 [Fusarium poae]KAG8666520.1 hypothetical protein FPOAC1_011328 [Fusarium poae]
MDYNPHSGHGGARLQRQHPPSLALPITNITGLVASLNSTVIEPRSSFTSSSHANKVSSVWKLGWSIYIIPLPLSLDPRYLSLSHLSSSS